MFLIIVYYPINFIDHNLGTICVVRHLDFFFKEIISPSDYDSKPSFHVFSHFLPIWYDSDFKCLKSY